MANSNSSQPDKFGSLIIPNCQHPTSQDQDLQSDPFSTGAKVFVDDTQSSSSSEIQVINLSESSSDEYHTPPQHNPSSQNSPNNSSASDPIPVDVDVDDDHNGESTTVDIAEECGGVLEDDDDDNFISLVNRARKMLEEAKKSGGGGDDDLDLIETANMAGWTLPRP